jgi:hypothetical protein
MELLVDNTAVESLLVHFSWLDYLFYLAATADH